MFSAADSRWTDLLRMLAKLSDGIEYSEKEIDEMTRQEKTKLVQKDPVTCSRYFEHRVQSKKISNGQELMQLDPTSCPQNQKGNNQIHKLTAVYERHSR